MFGLVNIDIGSMRGFDRPIYFFIWVYIKIPHFRRVLFQLYWSPLRILLRNF